MFYPAPYVVDLGLDRELTWMLLRSGLLCSALAWLDCAESYNNAIARLVASLAQHDPDSLSFILTSFLLGDPSTLPPTQLSSATMRELVDLAPHVLYDIDKREVLARVLRHASGSGVPPSVARPARDTRELMKERKPWCDDEEITSKL